MHKRTRESSHVYIQSTAPLINHVPLLSLALNLDQKGRRPPCPLFYWRSCPSPAKPLPISLPSAPAFMQHAAESAKCHASRALSTLPSEQGLNDETL